MTQLDVYGFDEALEMALSAAVPLRRKETVMIDRALGRVIAHEVICRKNMPAFDNSAMDGFAVRTADAGKRVRVIGTIYAGDIPPRQPLRPGEAWRIMTGAQVPPGVETVVPIENCPEVTQTHVTLPENLKPGNNIRLRGEEQREGSALFPAGVRLEASHIAMLSAQGIVAVTAYTPLRIAVVSTGDEIREPWESSTEDEIYNANAFGITALLSTYGFAPTYAGSIPDSLEATVAFIADLKGYDVVISTGGISMGDADFLYEAFERNGMEPIFHGVNVKPGRPAMMGMMGSTFVMAMPGNPLTAMVNIHLLSIPVLFKLQGASAWYHPFVHAENAVPFKARPGRTNLVLGTLRDGRFHVTRNNKYGSGMLTPLMESNAVAVFGEERSGAEAGETIRVVPMAPMAMAESNGVSNR